MSFYETIKYINYTLKIIVIALVVNDMKYEIVFYWLSYYYLLFILP